jgi:hypothetical protein
MNRIEVTAILKSAIEAGHPPDQLANYLQTASVLLTQYGTDRMLQAQPSIPSVPVAGAPAPAAGNGAPMDHGTHTLTLQSIEDHGGRVRVTASGFQGAKYFTAFGDEAAAFRLMTIPTVFSATIKSKPNPNKPGTNYWNIYNAQVQPQASQTAQNVAPPEDIPF